MTRRVSYALSIWPTETVSRNTISALMPDVDSAAHTMGFNRVLRTLADRDLIVKDGHFVTIKDRKALRRRAVNDFAYVNHRMFLDIDAAADRIEAQLFSERQANVAAVRRRELEFIRSLMVPSAHGNRESRRRLVRQESGAITVALGATTGQRPKALQIPTFPVKTISAANDFTH